MDEKETIKEYYSKLEQELLSDLSSDKYLKFYDKESNTLFGRKIIQLEETNIPTNMLDSDILDTTSKSDFLVLGETTIENSYNYIKEVSKQRKQFKDFIQS